MFVYLLYRRTAEQKLYEAALEAESRMAEAQAGNLILERLRADIGSLPAALDAYRLGGLLDGRRKRHGRIAYAAAYPVRLHHAAHCGFPYANRPLGYRV